MPRVTPQCVDISFFLYSYATNAVATSQLGLLGDSAYIGHDMTATQWVQAVDESAIDQAQLGMQMALM